MVCLALAARTWARNADWFDDRTLWASAVQVCPDSYKTHENLAMLALAQPQPDYPAATREVERALAILDPLPDDRSMPCLLYTSVNPAECIDCGACIPVCPTNSIYTLDELPVESARFAELNAAHYN